MDVFVLCLFLCVWMAKNKNKLKDHQFEQHGWRPHYTGRYREVWDFMCISLIYIEGHSNNLTSLVMLQTSLPLRSVDVASSFMVAAPSTTAALGLLPSDITPSWFASVCNLLRPVARIDFLGVQNPPPKVDLLDPKSGLFLTSPPYPPTKTPFLVHVVATSGPFGRFGGCVTPTAPPWLRDGPESAAVGKVVG